MNTEEKELVTVIKGGSEFTMPRENIKCFALYEALQRGITHGNIHDEKTSIDFLLSIGIQVIVDNKCLKDNTSFCVCKYKPCIEIEKLKEENNLLKDQIKNFYNEENKTFLGKNIEYWLNLQKKYDLIADCGFNIGVDNAKLHYLLTEIKKDIQRIAEVDKYDTGLVNECNFIIGKIEKGLKNA